MTEQTAPSFFERLKNLTTLWRDYTTSTRGEVLPPLKPDLPEDDMEKVRHQMQACLEGRGGDVSARARAAELGRGFLSLDQEGRERFLRMMASEFDTDHDAVIACCEQLAKADTVEARDKAEPSPDRHAGSTARQAVDTVQRPTRRCEIPCGHAGAASPLGAEEP